MSNGDSRSSRTPLADSISQIDAETAGSETIIVQISDIHGYIESAKSALLAVGEIADLQPVVERDDHGRLHWAGNDHYILVFNGDMVDRGPANEESLELVWRLQREAPAGQVRYLLGNHEMAILLPGVLFWPHWFSGQVSSSVRETFYEAILEGRITAAFDGHQHTYTHAGAPHSIDVSKVNESLCQAVEQILETEKPRREEVQQQLVERYPTIFGMGRDSVRGPGAGILWLDYLNMPKDAPAQVVGHTRHSKPIREGNVICANVIRNNEDTPGGEGVVIEHPNRIGVVVRKHDGSVSRTYFTTS